MDEKITNGPPARVYRLAAAILKFIERTEEAEIEKTSVSGSERKSIYENTNGKYILNDQKGKGDIIEAEQ